MPSKTHSFQNESQFHKDKFYNGFLSLVRLFVDNGMTINTIKHCFDQAMVDYCIDRNPDASNNTIAFSTGLDRRTVSQIRNGSRKFINKQDKYSSFISALKNEQEYNNDGFPIHIDTFHFLFNKHLNGSNSAEQTLNSLINDGYVKRKDNQIKVLEWGRVKGSNNSDILFHISNLIMRAVNVKYMNKLNNKVIFDNAIIFDDIPFNSVDELDVVVLDKLRANKKELIEIINDYRDPVKKANGECLAEYGVYSLNFRQEK